MALSFFSEQVSGRKPFVEDFLLANKHLAGESFSISSVGATRKGTGYMLETASFSVFLFGDSLIAKQMLEALEHYCKHMLGFEMFVQLVDKSPYYQLGIDSEKPATWAFSKGKYIVSADTISGLESSVQIANPFILPLTQKAMRKNKPQ